MKNKFVEEVLAKKDIEHVINDLKQAAEECDSLKMECIKRGDDKGRDTSYGMEAAYRKVQLALENVVRRWEMDCH